MAAPTSHGQTPRAPGAQRGEGRGATRGPAGEVEAFYAQDIGDDALAFTKWFVRNKFALMEGFTGELDRDPLIRNRRALKERFLHAVRHAQQVLLVRLAVTVLLSLGALTTAAALVLEQLVGSAMGGFQAVAGGGGFEAATVLGQLMTSVPFLEQLQAVAGTLTLVLVVVRLALDRYLELITVTCNYTAMQLASSR